MFTSEEIVLSTNKITLRPLNMDHLQDFYQAGKFPDIWTWSLPDKCSSIAATKEWLAYSQSMARQGLHVPFAIFDNSSGALVGSSRYCSINEADKSVEIGFTFITPKAQRSYVNTHAKYCLLKYAFETLNLIRVEFKTHEKNSKSRNAILRIGAKFEGILRNQKILPDNSYRNTAIFSVIESEWPDVKEHLLTKMAATYE